MFPLENIGCTPDEHVKEVDEGELNEGGEDGHEAHDDEDVEGSGISYLRSSHLTTYFLCLSVFCGFVEMPIAL